MGSSSIIDPAVIGRLRARATAKGVPSDVAAKAVRAVRTRAMSGCGEWDDRRAEAYFWGVVRRTAMSGGGKTRELRARFVEASGVAPVVTEQMRLAV